MAAEAKNIKEITSENAKKRLAFMSKYAEELKRDLEKIHVYISSGNRKTGDLVPSVSLRPVLDCGNCGACNKLCYDLRNDCMYTNVMKTRCKNAVIWENDPERYFKEISQACQSFVSFRWHVGGDIVNDDYLKGMIQVALENPKCKFLAFTKMFDTVNRYLESGGQIPENFQIIFSGWLGQKMDNPYNLPTSHPMFANGQTSAPQGYKMCPGNCSNCLLHNVNCWALKRGEAVVFNAH